MKKIALILAVIMMFSAVSVFAAPSVEHIFYGVDDETGIPAYFVFGKYTNNSTTSGTWVSEDVGVYYNGTKYSYVKDGNTTNKTGLFGIAFDDKDGVKDKMTSFKVQPYSVSNYGEVKGVTHEYDFANNVVKASTNANLASVSIEREQENKGGLMALMSPAFDPDIKEYVIYGYFKDAGYNLSNVKLHFTTEDPKAEIDGEAHYTKMATNGTITGANNFDSNGEYANYYEVVVKAPAGNTKTYRFNFHTSSSSSGPYYSNNSNVARPTAYFCESLDNGTYTNIKYSSTDVTTKSIYAYPTVGKEKSQYFGWTFNITDGMKNASIITLNASNVNALNFGGLKNVVIAARAYDATTKLGDIGGTFVLRDSSEIPDAGYTSALCGIDVTSIVKAAIEAGKSQISIALQIVDFEAENSADEPALTFAYGTYTGTNGRSASLCWNE